MIGVAVLASAVAVALWTNRPAHDTADRQPVAVHFSDLAPAVYRRGHYRGQVVRIVYPSRLHPTADPLVWEFRPGSDQLPPTHRIHFAESPPSGLLTVLGTVDGIDPDGMVRLNNVPGVVVIRGAAVTTTP